MESRAQFFVSAQLHCPRASAAAALPATRSEGVSALLSPAGITGSADAGLGTLPTVQHTEEQHGDAGNLVVSCREQMCQVAEIVECREFLFSYRSRGCASSNP